jgi:ATP-binding cassette subfamily F protein 3
MSWRSGGAVDRPEYMEAHAKHDALNDPQVDAKAKKMLAGLGYREHEFERKAKELSGGWVMRAHLARLLVMEPDLLLLDEPTNHLDLVSLLWLQNYLANYSGALLLISHDRQFMDEVVTQVSEIADRKADRLHGQLLGVPDPAGGANYESADGGVQEPAEGDRRRCRSSPTGSVR